MILSTDHYRVCEIDGNLIWDNHNGQTYKGSCKWEAKVRVYLSVQKALSTT